MPKLTKKQKETLELFTACVNKLMTLVAGLSEQELDFFIAPGEWTIRQILHHVSEDGDAWSMNFKKAIATPGVPIRFEGFPGNQPWADALAFEKRPIKSALALLHSHRQVIAELAEYFPGAWEQYVVIVDSHGQETARVSAGQIIRMLTEHLREHTATIEATKQQHHI